MITFHKDGKQATGAILDGNYLVDNPPIGLCKVSIQGPTSTAGPAVTPEIPGAKDGGKLPSATAKASAKVPAKYNNPETSGLTFEVKSGKTTKNFDLE